ncbi:MAG: hypothetical protein JZU55_10550, partial [Afipia sp.]|nr:hypothetical protein [Afipia sp.]
MWTTRRLIDLGHEPPLSVDGSEAAVIDRRRVSVQWFSGTILTGLCGAALIGGAVFASLDGEMTFARVPEHVEGALRGAFGANDKGAVARKSDRLPPPKVPAFNAQRMLTDVGSPTPAEGDDPQAGNAAEPDAEVSFVTRDLASVLPRAKIAANVAIDEVLMRVRDASNWRGNSAVRYASSTPADFKMAYAAEGTPDPYAGFEARVVPENVTLLPKTKDQVTGGNPSSEKIH